MASHNLPRTPRAPRTPAQRQAEQEKIASYRALDTRLLDLNAAAVAGGPYSTVADSDALLALTADVLLRNPEHYTAWNARRRCLTCGSLSRPSRGPSLSAQPPKSSAPSTSSTPSAALSSLSSDTIPPGPRSQAPAANGKSGTTAEPGEHDAESVQDEEKARQGKALETIKSELMFILPLIKAHPKCYWIWNYRLWLLQQAIVVLPVAVARRVWEEELGLVSMMLNRDQRNFHAWGYRRHVVGKLEGHELAGNSMAEDEFAYTRRKIEGALSNFSAWHHRSKIIPRLLTERGADDAMRRAFLESEFDLVRRSLDVGAEDQSCWYYHQYLVCNMTEPNTAATIAPNLEVAVKVDLLRSEIENTKELLEDYDGKVKLAVEAIIDYSLAIAHLEGREATVEERDEIRGWIAEVRKLDPKRKGRWDDLERQHSL